MITIFNRRELITISSDGKYMDICQLLNLERIARYTKFVGAGGGMGRRGRGVYCQTAYTIFVHRDDYDRALQAIQPALRNNY